MAGIKVGEVYIEIFPKINEAARRAATASVAEDMRSAYSKAFGEIEKEDNRLTGKQVQNRRTVSKESKKSAEDAGNFFDRFVKKATTGETRSHKLATQLRTIGTIIRGISVPAAIVGGLNLVSIALKGIVAILPIVEAGILALPAAMAALIVESFILKAAFKGVGKAISDGLDPAKAKQFQKDLEKLAPAAQTFVKQIVALKGIIPNIQQTFFSAPSLQRAGARMKGFFKGISASFTALVRQNGDTFGKILGTATNSSGTKLTARFLTNIRILLKAITPGLQAVTHGFQVLIANVSGQGASRGGGANNALKKFGDFLAHINVAKIFDAAAAAINAFKPVLKNVHDIFIGIGKALGGNQAIGQTFFRSITNITGTISKFINSKDGQQFIQDLDQLLTTLGKLTSSALTVALQALGTAIHLLLPPLKTIADWADKHPKQFQAVAIAIGAMVAAWKLFTIASGIARAAAIQLDIALNANIIGLIIVAIAALAAGIIFLQVKFKFFTKGWTQFIPLLLGPVGIMIFLGFHFKQVGKIAVIVAKALVVAWNAVWHFFAVSIPHAFHIFVGAFVNAYNWILGATHTVWKFIIDRWHDVYNFFTVKIPLALKVIWTKINHYWNLVIYATGVVRDKIVGAWNAVVHFFTVTIPLGLKVLWLRILQYWNAILYYVGIVRDRIIGAWNRVVHFFTVTIPNAAKWLWSKLVGFWNAIGRVTEGLKNKVLGIWNRILDFFRKDIPKAFGVFKKWISNLWKTIEDRIGQFARKFVDLMKGIPAGVLKVLKSVANNGFIKPLNWVITHVYTRGIRRLWNSFADAVGLKSIKLPELANIKNFATGGHVRGPGGPREDKIPAMLSNGEYVVNAAATSRNRELLDQINSNGYRNGGEVQHFAKGGAAGVAWPSIVNFARKIGAMAGLHVTSTTGGGHAAGSYHYRGMAVDISGGIAAMNRAAAKLAGYGRYFLELIHQPGVFWKNGRQVGPYGGPHADHIHMASSKGLMAAAYGRRGLPPLTAVGPSGQQQVGFGLPPFLAKIWAMAKKGTTYLTDPVNAIIAKLPGLKSLNPFMKGLVKTGIPHLLSSAAKFITDKISDLALSLAGPGISEPGKNITEWIQQASKYIKGGIPRSWYGQLGYIIRHESGNNPHAINNTDSNAKAGIPSQGLMQLIPPNFKKYVPPFLKSLGIQDPIANIAAGVNYIKARYGSPGRTPWFHGQSYYKDGGFVGGPQLFDSGQGTLMPGWTAMLNNTGKPEHLSTRNRGVPKVETHVYIGNEEITDMMDSRIAKHDNDLIQYIVTR